MGILSTRQGYRTGIIESGTIKANVMATNIEKGAECGQCNRTACSNSGARWFNHSTKKYYCTPCAQLINGYNHADAMRLFGHELCTIPNNTNS